MKYVLFANLFHDSSTKKVNPTSSSEANRTKAEEPEDPSLAPTPKTQKYSGKLA